MVLRASYTKMIECPIMTVRLKMDQMLLPNHALELTAHSARFMEVRGFVACGPQLTAGVRRTMHGRGETHPREAAECPCPSP